MEPLTSTASSPPRIRRRMEIAGFQVTPDELNQIDFTNKSTLTKLVWVVCLVVICLVSVIVVLRLIVRRRTAGRWFLDDALIVLASIFTLVVASVTLVATQYGLGQHVWNLEIITVLETMKQCIKLLFVGNVFYALAIAFTKLSIISSYLHIFSPTGTMKYILYATGVVTIGLLITSVPATIFQCTPVQAAWDFTIKDHTCYPFTHFLYASTGINIATDLVLCTVPIPTFWTLQLPRRQKILVSVLFFVGGFAGVASMIRVAYLHLLDGTHIDLTFNIVSSLLWTLAECTIGIVCVSLPSLRPLLAKLLPDFFRSRWTTHRTAASSRPRPVELGSMSGKTSGRGSSTSRVVESTIDKMELVANKHASWQVLPDRDAHSDSAWEGSERKQEAAEREGSAWV